MDYFKRKKLTMDLIKKMLESGESDERIERAVEELYQMSPLWVRKYLKRIRGED